MFYFRYNSTGVSKKLNNLNTSLHTKRLKFRKFFRNNNSSKKTYDTFYVETPCLVLGSIASEA